MLNYFKKKISQISDSYSDNEEEYQLSSRAYTRSASTMMVEPSRSVPYENHLASIKTQSSYIYKDRVQLAYTHAHSSFPRTPSSNFSLSSDSFQYSPSSDSSFYTDAVQVPDIPIVSPKPWKAYTPDGRALASLAREWSYMNFQPLGDMEKKRDREFNWEIFLSDDGYLTDERVCDNKYASFGDGVLPEPTPYPPRDTSGCGAHFVHSPYRYQPGLSRSPKVSDFYC